MPVQSNIQNLIDKFKSLSEAGGIDFSAALVLGVNAARGAMLTRIFNNGEDAVGKSFGKYSGKKSRITKRRFSVRGDDPADSYVRGQLKKQAKRAAANAKETGESQFTEYEKKRLAEGRQIKYKDLEFHGALRRSIVTVSKDATKVACEFTSQQQRQIAQYQEEQIGRINGSGVAVIFSLSEEERELMKTNVNAGIKNIYDRIFNVK